VSDEVAQRKCEHPVPFYILPPVRRARRRVSAARSVFANTSRGLHGERASWGVKASSWHLGYYWRAQAGPRRDAATRVKDGGLISTHGNQLTPVF
jgi:hypothetical protein